MSRERTAAFAGGPYVGLDVVGGVMAGAPPSPAAAEGPGRARQGRSPGSAVTADVAGGSQRAGVPVEERPAIHEMISERGPARQLALCVLTQPGIWSRVGPLLRVLAVAADSEPDLARLQQEQDAQRMMGLTRFATPARRGTTSPPRVAPAHPEGTTASRQTTGNAQAPSPQRDRHTPSLSSPRGGCCWLDGSHQEAAW